MSLERRTDGPNKDICHDTQKDFAYLPSYGIHTQSEPLHPTYSQTPSKPSQARNSTTPSTLRPSNSRSS